EDRFTDLDFANNAVILAESIEALIRALERLSEESECMGLWVSWIKTVRDFFFGSIFTWNNHHVMGYSFMLVIVTSEVFKCFSFLLLCLDITFVKVSKVTGRVEVNDVLAAVRPNTCLISVMLANNETGVIMVRSIKMLEDVKGILLHSDGAQAVGKVKVDVQELGVDYLTIVGHKFYGPRIGALYVNKPGSITPLFPMFFGGGQERNFRPGSQNAKFIVFCNMHFEFVIFCLCKHYDCRVIICTNSSLFLYPQTVFGKEKIHFNSHFPGSETLPNTCNVSLLGPGLEGWKVLSSCRWLLASVGAACHSDKVER
uniref:Selenocysteine lyase n=1 Tax=Paramormyrops kingsleyae TaxID=1676925 RepID=A0A3B3R9M6_9TELE